MSEGKEEVRSIGHVRCESYLRDDPFVEYFTPKWAKWVWRLSLLAALVCIVAFAVMMGFRSVDAYGKQRVFSFMGMCGGILIGSLVGISVLATQRLFLEAVLVLFSINNHLAWIREHKHASASSQVR